MHDCWIFCKFAAEIFKTVMNKFYRFILSVLLVSWTLLVYGDSKTIVITESALPYQSQTWFFNTDEGAIRNAIKTNWDEGRRITSGAYTDKGWFLTMAKNTTISMQTYSFTADWPSSWIEKNWKEGYYITTISYSGSQWLVVMSQDSRISYQRWRRDSWSNLEKWIKSCWDEGYRITEAAHNGTYWTIVMSKTNYIGAQSYVFTSGDVNKNINEAWNSGYRIQLLNHGGGQFFLVNCKYFENNGRSQGCNTQVTNIQQYISEKWAVPENIAYIGGGDNYVQYTAPQQYNAYPQYVPPTGNYNNPYGGSPEPTQQHRPCAGCHGTGLCSMCKGKGWYEYQGKVYDCSVCHGSGRCGVCHGKGHCN